MGAWWRRKRRESSGASEDSGGKKRRTPDPRRVAAKALSENLFYATSVRHRVAVQDSDVEAFQDHLASSGFGLVVDFFGTTERPEACIIFPDEFVQQLTTDWLAVHGPSVAPDDLADTTVQQVRALNDVVGYLPDWFTLVRSDGGEEGETSGWIPSPGFILPNRFDSDSLIPVFWRYADYHVLSCASDLGTCFFLVAPDTWRAITEHILNEEYRTALAKAVLRRENDDGTDSQSTSTEPIDHGEPIRAHMIQLQRPEEFELGQFLFPRDLADPAVRVSYTRLGVGPVFPSSGVCIGWSFTAAEANQDFDQFFVFPNLTWEEDDQRLIVSLAKTAVRRLTELLGSYFTLKTRRLSRVGEFEWTDDHFVLEAVVHIGKRSIPILVYAHIEWVKYLIEEFNIYVSWDIRERSTRSFLMTLLTFSVQRFAYALQEADKRVVSGDPQTVAPQTGAPQVDDRDQAGAQSANGSFLELRTVGDLLGMASARDRMQIIQIFLIGRLGMNAARLRRLFYHAANGVITPIAGFRSSVLFPHLGKRFLEDWKSARSYSFDLSDLQVLNAQTLQLLFRAYLAGTLELGFRTRYVLDKHFLEPHNREQRRLIQELVDDRVVPERIAGMTKAEKQSLFSHFPTRSMALACLGQPGLLDEAQKHMSSRNREDVQHFLKQYSQRTKGRATFDWEDVRIAMLALSQGITSAERIKKAKETGLDAAIAGDDQCGCEF